MSTETNTATQDTATFLSQSIVQEGLRIDEIKQQLANNRATEKDAFFYAVQLSQSIASACAWFNSPEGKTQRDVDGIVWKQYDMTKAIFKLGKTQSAQYVKVAKLVGENAKLVEHYTEFVKLQKDSDELEQYGLKGLVRYAKDEEATEEEEKAIIVGKLTFGAGKDGFKVTLDENGVVNTFGNSVLDLQNVLAIMSDALDKQLAEA